MFNLVGPAGVDYDLFIYNSTGAQIGSGEGTTATESVNLSNQAAGTYYIKVNGYSGANSASCYTITATATASRASANAIIKQEDNKYLKISPNPVIEKLNISIPSGISKAQISVIDVSGKTILKQISNGSNSTIDVSKLSIGLYIIKVEEINGKAVFISKFIKE